MGSMSEAEACKAFEQTFGDCSGKCGWINESTIFQLEETQDRDGQNLWGLTVLIHLPNGWYHDSRGALISIDDTLEAAESRIDRLRELVQEHEGQFVKEAAFELLVRDFAEHSVAEGGE